jgi:iron complex outermembrane receptor protein
MTKMATSSLFVCLVLVSTVGASPALAQQTTTGTVRVTVTSESKPVAGAEVRVGDRKTTTSAEGSAALSVPSGSVTVVVALRGFVERSVTAVVTAGAETAVAVELEPQPEHTEQVVVTATRSEKRLQDEPLRVEVLGREEIEEKLLMTPGDIAMLLSETTGLRVQVTSPGLGAASLRIQGLRGRYTQLLSDGLPLYGGEAGSIGLLQIPPMDLGQVEVIKGVASSLYGGSALGGVVNLVSRKPGSEPEREMLINQTTQGQTNALVWLSGPVKEGSRWGYTFLGGVDRQLRHDVDEDGWVDVAGFDRLSARPRFTWDNGVGRSLFFTVGVMGENRRGGTLPGRTVTDGSSYVEALDTRRVDFGVVARWLVGTKVASVRGSFMRRQHRHEFGATTEHDVQRTGFGEISLTGTRGSHTWVVGGAVQADDYQGREVTRADYNISGAAVFAQDEFVAHPRLTLAGSVRVDGYSRRGGFVSPRASALVRAPGGWTVRASGGSGFFVARTVTEETEAAGLTPLSSFDISEPERALSGSLDANREFGPVEFNGTVFASRVTNTLRMRPALAGPAPAYDLVPLSGPTRTTGVELLARIRRGAVSLTPTYTYVHATEPDPVTSVRGDVGYTPRHSAGFTAMWEREGVARVGFEAYFTGRQTLEHNPFRATSPAYPYFGALVERQFGRLRAFVNFENFGNLRQTNTSSLVRPTRNFDGRWTVDAWAPLEGFTVNGGVRVTF